MPIGTSPSYGGRAGEGVPQALVGPTRGPCPNEGPLAGSPRGAGPVIALTVPAPPPLGGATADILKRKGSPRLAAFVRREDVSTAPPGQFLGPRVAADPNPGSCAHDSTACARAVALAVVALRWPFRAVARASPVRHRPAGARRHDAGAPRRALTVAKVRRHGAWRSLVSALVWGTRGPRFESGRPD